MNKKFSITHSEVGYKDRNEVTEKIADVVYVTKSFNTVESLIKHLSNSILNGHILAHNYYYKKNVDAVGYKAFGNIGYNTFKDTHFVFLDFDKSPIPMDEIISVVKIKPILAYETYSGKKTDENGRSNYSFRFVFILDEPITSAVDFVLNYRTIHFKTELFIRRAFPDFPTDVIDLNMQKPSQTCFGTSSNRDLRVCGTFAYIFDYSHKNAETEILTSDFHNHPLLEHTRSVLEQIEKRKKSSKTNSLRYFTNQTKMKRFDAVYTERMVGMFRENNAKINYKDEYNELHKVYYVIKRTRVFFKGKYYAIVDENYREIDRFRGQRTIPIIKRGHQRRAKHLHEMAKIYLQVLEESSRTLDYLVFLLIYELVYHCNTYEGFPPRELLDIACHAFRKRNRYKKLDKNILTDKRYVIDKKRIKRECSRIEDSEERKKAIEHKEGEVRRAANKELRRIVVDRLQSIIDVNKSRQEIADAIVASEEYKGLKWYFKKPPSKHIAGELKRELIEMIDEGVYSEELSA